MVNQDDGKKDVVQLNEQEMVELDKGRKLYEMVKSNPGWQIINEILNTAAYHAWVDPRKTSSKEEWEWQELNAFHAANNAKELLETIAEMISRSEYLDKVKNGEIQRKSMTIR